MAKVAKKSSESEAPAEDPQFSVSVTALGNPVNRSESRIKRVVASGSSAAVGRSGSSSGLGGAVGRARSPYKPRSKLEELIHATEVLAEDPLSFPPPPPTLEHSTQQRRKNLRLVFPSGATRNVRISSSAGRSHSESKGETPVDKEKNGDTTTGNESDVSIGEPADIPGGSEEFQVTVKRRRPYRTQPRKRLPLGVKKPRNNTAGSKYPELGPNLTQEELDQTMSMNAQRHFMFYCANELAQKALISRAEAPAEAQEWIDDLFGDYWRLFFGFDRRGYCVELPVEVEEEVLAEEGVVPVYYHGPPAAVSLG